MFNISVFSWKLHPSLESPCLSIHKEWLAHGEKGVYKEKRGNMITSCGLKSSTVIRLFSRVNSASIKAVLVLSLGWGCPCWTSFKTPLQSSQSKHLAGGLALHPRAGFPTQQKAAPRTAVPPQAPSSPLTCEHALPNSASKEKEKALFWRQSIPHSAIQENLSGARIISNDKTAVLVSLGPIVL